MKIVTTICIVGIGLLFAYVEVMLILQNFWNILNPFLQLKALFWVMTAPLFWIFAIVLAICVWIDYYRKEKV